MADQAGATMADVLHFIQRVTPLMGELGNASDEQSLGSRRSARPSSLLLRQQIHQELLLALGSRYFPNAYFTSSRQLMRLPNGLGAA